MYRKTQPRWFRLVGIHGPPSPPFQGASVGPVPLRPRMGTSMSVTLWGCSLAFLCCLSVTTVLFSGITLVSCKEEEKGRGRISALYHKSKCSPKPVLPICAHILLTGTGVTQSLSASRVCYSCQWSCSKNRRGSMC